MRSLLTILKNILQRLDIIEDFIVEQGTSGTWTYRKWNSGIAECWGKTTKSTAVTIAWGGGSYMSDLCTSPNYPTGLFTSVDCVNFTVHSARDSIAWGMLGYTSTPLVNPGQYRIVKGALMNGNHTFTIYYHTRGKWK